MSEYVGSKGSSTLGIGGSELPCPPARGTEDNALSSSTASAARSSWVAEGCSLGTSGCSLGHIRVAALVSAIKATVLRLAPGGEAALPDRVRSSDGSQERAAPLCMLVPLYAVPLHAGNFHASTLYAGTLHASAPRAPPASQPSQAAENSSRSDAAPGGTGGTTAQYAQHTGTVRAARRHSTRSTTVQAPRGVGWLALPLGGRPPRLTVARHQQLLGDVRHLCGSATLARQRGSRTSHPGAWGLAAVCGLQSAVYSLRSTVCGLQSAVYSLQTTICGLQSGATCAVCAPLTESGTDSSRRELASIMYV